MLNCAGRLEFPWPSSINSFGRFLANFSFSIFSKSAWLKLLTSFVVSTWDGAGVTPLRLLEEIGGGVNATGAGVCIGFTVTEGIGTKTDLAGGFGVLITGAVTTGNGAGATVFGAESAGVEESEGAAGVKGFASFSFVFCLIDFSSGKETLGRTACSALTIFTSGFVSGLALFGVLVISTLGVVIVVIGLVVSGFASGTLADVVTTDVGVAVDSVFCCCLL